MKGFLKTIGCGLAVILVSLFTVTMIWAAILALFVDLPVLTGIAAVGKFLMAMAWFLLSIMFIYILGAGLIKYEEG